MKKPLGLSPLPTHAPKPALWRAVDAQDHVADADFIRVFGGRDAC